MKESQAGERFLTSILRTVAIEDEKLGASAEVEGRLLAEVQSIARVRRVRTNWIGLAAAAAVFVAAAVPGWLWSRGSAPNRGPLQRADAVEEVTTPFFPLPYSNVPVLNAHLVRMQVPRSALASFGVTSFDAPGDSATVLADVVVGDDGLARAVRFVSYYEQQELQP